MAFDENLVKKLQMEIGSLKEVLSIRRKKGKFNDVESQLLRLKVNNEHDQIINK